MNLLFPRQYKSKEIVSAKCSKCASIRNVVFAELIRTVNNQGKFVDSYHCPTCYRNLDIVKFVASEKSKSVVHKITRGSSDRSKRLWADPEYKAKCLANAQKLKNNEQFAQKISKSIKKKFNDPEYIEKITKARQKYWSDPNYRGTRLLSLEEFITRANEIHGYKYDYSKIRYVNVKSKVDIICSFHGVFSQRPSHHLIYNNGCPQCALNLTRSDGEDQICKLLSESGVDFQTNVRDILDGYEIDVYVPKYKLGIEYHGLFWHSYAAPELRNQKYKHHRKAELADSKGVKLLQFYDYEWENKNEVVKSMILNGLQLSARYGARNCSLVHVNDTDAKAFFNQHHLQGHQPADVTFGLFNDKLLAAMSFVERQNGVYEVMRCANAVGTVVSGGLSKMFKNFVREFNPSKVVTYANRRYSTAVGYRNLGFLLHHITKPDYSYSLGKLIFDRRKFQKHKLSAILEKFDSNLTEAQNMFNNGYRRLWGAGHYYLEWVRPECI